MKSLKNRRKNKKLKISQDIYENQQIYENKENFTSSDSTKNILFS